MSALLTHGFRHSVAMACVALSYIAAASLLKKRYTSKGIYYTGLVVALGFLVPFRPNITLPVLPSALAAVHAGESSLQRIVALPAASTAAAVSSVAAPKITPAHALLLLWALGAVCVLTYHGLRHLHFSRMLKRWSAPVTQHGALALFTEISDEMGIKRPVQLFACACITSPMLVGVFRPRILLPNRAMQSADMRFFLQHELVHHARRDLWGKILLLLAVTVNWFNPFVYLLAKTVMIFCEMSCDEAVLHRCDTQARHHYALAILGVAQRRSRWNTAISTYLYGDKQTMKKRITGIMTSSKKRAGAVLLTAGLCLSAIAGTTFALSAKQLPQAQGSSGGSSRAADPSSASPSDSSSTSRRTRALIEDFEPFERFGLSYDAQNDAVLYQGQRVRLFVVYQDKSANAFDLCWRDKTLDTGLYLRAVKDKEGKVTGIAELKIHDEIVQELVGVRAGIDKERPNLSDGVSLRYYVMDGNHIIEKYGIHASDMTLEQAPASVQKWIASLPAGGAHIMQKKTASGYDTYLYYGDGGRYPWFMEADGQTAFIHLESTGSEGEGYHLMRFTAPAMYPITLTLDGKTIPLQ